MCPAPKFLLVHLLLLLSSTPLQWVRLLISNPYHSTYRSWIRLSEVPVHQAHCELFRRHAVSRLIFAGCEGVDHLRRMDEGKALGSDSRSTTAGTLPPSPILLPAASAELDQQNEPARLEYTAQPKPTTTPVPHDGLASDSNSLGSSTLGSTAPLNFHWQAVSTHSLDDGARVTHDADSHLRYATPTGDLGPSLTPLPALDQVHAAIENMPQPPLHPAQPQPNPPPAPHVDDPDVSNREEGPNAMPSLVVLASTEFPHEPHANRPSTIDDSSPQFATSHPKSLASAPLSHAEPMSPLAPYGAAGSPIPPNQQPHDPPYISPSPELSVLSNARDVNIRSINFGSSSKAIFDCGSVHRPLYATL
jgi:hypothetical protein